MSVQSDNSRIQYTGNGSAVTPYPVPFVFLEATHIRCVVIDEGGNEIPLTLGSEYTVAGVDSKNGGSVVTKTAVPATRKLTIYREVPAVQQTKFLENDKMPSASIEKALDRLTMICQQLTRKVSRAFRFSDSSPPFDEITTLQAASDSVLVSGADGRMHLWSLKKIAEEISAIAAVPPMLNALMVQYPVGCLYFTRRNENPRDILGFGTWRRFGAGRMIVSLDPANEALSQVDAVGGEAAHALTVAELALHDHVDQAFSVTASIEEHRHRIPSRSLETGDAKAELRIPMDDDGGNSTAAARKTDGSPDGSRMTLQSENHKHPVTIPESYTDYSSGAGVSIDVPERDTSSTGEGQPHNNMPPYIVVHVWTRIVSDLPEEGVGTLPFPADPTLIVDRVTGETRRLVLDDSVIGTISVP